MAAAGITQDVLLASGIGPAALDAHITFQHELRGGDEVDVGCVFLWTGPKVFDIVQDFTRADGTRSRS
jgi:acyl-CoA thioester hydrolase